MITIFKAVFLTFLALVFQGSCNESTKREHKSSRLMNLYHATVKVLIGGDQLDALIKKFNVDYAPAESLEGVPNIEEIDTSTDVNDVLSKILKKKEVKVGALKGKNWGSIGNYQVDPPTGFWPEFMFLIWRNISKRIFDDENAIKVKYLYFSDVFNALNTNEIDLTENYFLSLSSVPGHGLRSDSSKVSQGLSLITHSNKIIILKEHNINNINDLKSHISNNSNVHIGCLSEANCKAFKDVFQGSVKYNYQGFSSYYDLSESVLSKNNLAAIVSGLPTDFNNPKLTVFDSLVKTSHSPFFSSLSLVNVLHPIIFSNLAIFLIYLFI